MRFRNNLWENWITRSAGDVASTRYRAPHSIPAPKLRRFVLQFRSLSDFRFLNSLSLSLSIILFIVYPLHCVFHCHIFLSLLTLARTREEIISSFSFPPPFQNSLPLILTSAAQDLSLSLSLRDRKRNSIYQRKRRPCWARSGKTSKRWRISFKYSD